MIEVGTGEALARDFLKLEALKQQLEAKQWQSLEEIQFRHQSLEQTRAASLGALDKQLQSSAKEREQTVSRNMVIRQQAAALTMSAKSKVLSVTPGSTGGQSEAVDRLRDSRQLYAMQVERMSSQWNKQVELRILEEIEALKQDTLHCQVMQNENLEASIAQERLLAELQAERKRSKQERARMYEEVQEKQQRLRQRLAEDRSAVDRQASEARKGMAQVEAEVAQDPGSEAVGQMQYPTGGPRAETQPPWQMPAEVLKKPKTQGSYIPAQGTRQFEVYKQLRSSEMEMQADLRILEDRCLMRCPRCSISWQPPGPSDGRCDCGSLLEVSRMPPSFSLGSALRPEPLPGKWGNALSSKAFSVGVRPPAVIQGAIRQTTDLQRPADPIPFAAAVAAQRTSLEGEGASVEAEALRGSEIMSQRSPVLEGTPHEVTIPAPSSVHRPTTPTPAVDNRFADAKDQAQAELPHMPELWEQTINSSATGDFLGSLGALDEPLPPFSLTTKPLQVSSAGLHQAEPSFQAVSSQQEALPMPPLQPQQQLENKNHQRKQYQWDTPLPLQPKEQTVHQWSPPLPKLQQQQQDPLSNQAVGWPSSAASARSWYSSSTGGSSPQKGPAAAPAANNNGSGTCSCCFSSSVSEDMSTGPTADGNDGSIQTGERSAPRIALAAQDITGSAGTESDNSGKALLAAAAPTMSRLTVESQNSMPQAPFPKAAVGLPLPVPCTAPVPNEAAACEKSAGMSPGELLDTKLSENDPLESSGEPDLDAMIPLSARDRTSSFRHMATNKPEGHPRSSATLPDVPHPQQQETSKAASGFRSQILSLQNTSTAATDVTGEMAAVVSSTTAADTKPVDASAAMTTQEPSVMEKKSSEGASPQPAAVVSQPNATQRTTMPEAAVSIEPKKMTIMEERTLEASLSASANSFFTFGEGSPSMGRNSLASNSHGSPKNASRISPEASAAAERAKAEKARAAELAEILGSDDDEEVSLPPLAVPKASEEKHEAITTAMEKAKDQRAAELAEILGSDDDSNEDVPPMLPKKKGEAQTKHTSNSLGEAKTPPPSAQTPPTSTPPPPGSSSSKQATSAPQSSSGKTQLAHDLGLDSGDSDEELKGSADAGSDAGSSAAASPTMSGLSKRGNPLASRGLGRGGGALWQSTKSDSFIGPGGGLGGLPGSQGIGLAKSLARSKSTPFTGISTRLKAKGLAKSGSGSMSSLGGPIDWSQAEGW
mmetsp:Transcript_78655/g.138713  ORF Transcript_78655/g.138713 Transcript_78655/m.138713 type:complete len:1223 (+) Transcript_78655:72-3740(+)|eukprot:CAMPEP_0197660684 /NCGR_PEP_ID=MMETSP1338-20131121/50998_1 /TAXON_ID=43686 ORGANISM="Pelagodinium beii, Strain RCC1491" /NCGR_SAMPLE_ID=MMETSP1338 /ASSEMBLY_ACC=CAM_ASM_000754 /LENGTH=1222 /DNA_ID=CAMNT_0043238093 /DNA_START=55 /DNA_END=3723 /DNA_ORIENTATION=+